jgi:hypothetical protein
VATSSQVPAIPITLEAVIPATSVVTPQATELQAVQQTQALATDSSTPSPLQTGAFSNTPADLGLLPSQIGWNILTPSYLPDGYHYQSAYYDPNQKLVVLTYLVTRPLAGATDPSLTSSETITLLQSQHNDFVPMQIAPNTNITDTLVNGAPAAFTIGGWDTEFVKDNQAAGGGKMVSSWRNDLPVKNLYWQVGNLYLALITADGVVSQQDLIELASSLGK